MKKCILETGHVATPSKIGVLRRIGKIDVGWQRVISATRSYEQMAEEAWSNKATDSGI